MNNVASLDDIFHKRVFAVPDYQRGYAWESRHVREFLEDLELLGPGRYHYTGTVVLHEPQTGSQKMDEDGNTYSIVEIVDGQQRLTTIVLLLDGIRRVLADLSEQGQSLSRGIEKNYIAATEINGQRLFKLSLNADTDHFFRQSILAELPGPEGPQIASERRLAETKTQIFEYLRVNMQRQGTEAETWLRTLYAKVATQLRFTLFQVEDEAEVGVIFEVMNGRGKPLTELERVKNYLLYASTTLDVRSDLGIAVNGAWAEILRQLMSAGLLSNADEDRLLRAHWLAHYDFQPRKWQGSRSVKELFDLRKYAGQHPDLLNKLHVYTEGLRASAVSFCDAYKPNRQDAFAPFQADPSCRAKVVEWSAKLARIGVIAIFLPILLAVRERWPTEPRKYLEILQLAEAFAFRVHRLRERRADAGQAMLFRIGFQVANNAMGFDTAVNRFKMELAYQCSGRTFEALVKEDNPQISNGYGWRGLRYFLYEYEVHLASLQGASPLISWDELDNRELKDTIEHILPQSIDQQPYWRERFGRRDHRRYLHDLGNLTLTKHNSYYLNKEFPIKKGAVDAIDHCYATSPLYVERELTQWQEWNASDIEERRTRLLDWARERWYVDLGSFDGQAHEEEEDGDEIGEDADLLSMSEESENQ